MSFCFYNQVKVKGNEPRNLVLFHLALPFQSTGKTNIFAIKSILADIIFASKWNVESSYLVWIETKNFAV